MRGISPYLGLLACFLCVVSFCYANDRTVEVIGIGECSDCKENSIKTSEAVSGLRVTIDCKAKSGNFKRRGSAELDAEGNFKVSLPQEIIKDGNLKEECYAQLHSASATPCPAHNGLQATKILAKSNADGKLTFGPAENVKFSSASCTSAFLWPFFKYPPFPKISHPWKKSFPKFWSHPPYKFPFPHHKPFPPIYKKPLPPPVPIYKPIPKPPQVPIYKPKPKPPVPIYKPKPKPPSIPIYKPPVIVKPLPPHVPIYKPPVIVKPLPPPVPTYKPPVIVKPLPPPIPPHPFPKIPHHPFPKIPHHPFPKIPPHPFPKIPPKTFFHHPIPGIFPPVPPHP